MFKLYNLKEKKTDESFLRINKNAVTSRLFTHIVSTEIMRKDMRGTKYIYYKGYFLILILIKSRQGPFPLSKICLLYI